MGIVSLEGAKVCLKRCAFAQDSCKGAGVSDRMGIGLLTTVYIKILIPYLDTFE